jgi:hypothetical protein
MNAFLGKLNYFPNISISKKFRSMKHEMVINIPFERLILSYSRDESLLKGDPNITRVTPLAYYNYESLLKVFKEKGWESELKFERTIAVHCFDVMMPPPLDPRIYHMSTSVHFDPEHQTFTVVSKPFKGEGLNFFQPSIVDLVPKKGMTPKKTKAYPMFDFIVLQYQRIDEEKTLFSQTHIMDFGGWGNNPAMIKLIAKVRRNNFTKCLEKLIQQYPEDAKIKDYEEDLCREDQNGLCCDGYGKMIFESNIGGKHEEWKKNKK